MRASPEKWHLSKDVQEVREGLWKSIPGRGHREGPRECLQCWRDNGDQR